MDGSCICDTTFYGRLCEHKCTGCLNSRSICNPVTGKCDCEPGLNGLHCHHGCIHPYYGMNCDQTCDCIHGQCDPINGTCTCNRSWVGKNCDVQEDFQKSVLNALKGLKKFSNNLPTKFINLFFSDFESKNCNNKCHNGICNFFDGTCKCFPGFTGQLCENEVQPQKCENNCSTKCDCDLQTFCKSISISPNKLKNESINHKVLLNEVKTIDKNNVIVLTPIMLVIFLVTFLIFNIFGIIIALKIQLLKINSANSFHCKRRSTIHIDRKANNKNENIYDELLHGMNSKVDGKKFNNHHYSEPEYQEPEVCVMNTIHSYSEVKKKSLRI